MDEQAKKPRKRTAKSAVKTKSETAAKKPRAKKAAKKAVEVAVAVETPKAAAAANKKPDVLISVVMPLYNNALRLSRAVRTVLSQLEAGNAELIIVDDCSTDGSAAYAEAICSSCGRAKVLRSKRNAGPGAARNVGVMEASGEYLYFHDSDDWLGDNALARGRAAIEKYGHPDVVCVPLGTMTDSTKPPKVDAVKFNGVDDSAFGPVSPMAQIIKREKFVTFPENTIAEDAPWHFIQWDQFKTFGKVEDDGTGNPFYVWDRTTGKSITDTITFCYNNPATLEVLAFCDVLPKHGKNDRWVSDFLRNVANMYDVRHLIRNPKVKEAWQARFRNEVINLMTCRYAH